MKNNKGFSLVELIIVIAIMAILVGVMAPQLIKYIEKSNVSSDTQLCDTIRTGVTTAMMDPEVINATDYTAPTDKTYSYDDLADCGSTFCKAVLSTLGETDESKATLSESDDLKFKSTYQGSKASGVKIAVKGSNQVQVYIDSSCAEGKKGATSCDNCTKISVGPEVDTIKN